MDFSRLRAILKSTCSLLEREYRAPLLQIQREIPTEISSLNRKWHRTVDAVLPSRLKVLPEFGYSPDREGLKKFHQEMFRFVKDHPSSYGELPDPTVAAACIVFEKERLDFLPNDVMKRVLIRYTIGLEEYDEIALEIKERMSGHSLEEREEELKGRLVNLTIESLQPEGFGDIDGWLRFSSSLTGYALTGDLEVMKNFQNKLLEIFSLLEDDNDRA